MSKEIKDYLHLYLGQRCKGNEGTMTYVLANVHKSGRGNVLIDEYGNVCVGIEFKLVLRDLSSMTELEKVELFRYIWPHEHSATPLGAEYCINFLLDIEADYPTDKWMEDYRESINNFEAWGSITTWLLSKGFDLFGLIPAKLAINAKELNHEKGN